MLRRGALIASAAAAAAALLAAAPGAAAAGEVTLREYRLPAAKMEKLEARWLKQLRSRHGSGWAPMRFELSDRDLALMGLPPKRVLQRQRYPVPTAVYPDGKTVRLTGGKSQKGPPDDRGKGNGKGGGNEQNGGGSSADPAIATYAGAGFFGIRPGAWLLLIDDEGIGWCSMAHVYGSPGSYSISTAGHCGKTGTTATAIGVVGNRDVPVLLDFGKFAQSQDGGLGKDWALIDVFDRYQHLVTPTMAFWGGPRGMYTKTGDLVSLEFRGRNLVPNVAVNPDPFLAQQIVHYGHGVGVGTGGTPRSGTAIAWREKHFMFFGAISPGDSGSGANTLLGDSAGANMEAAGIMTHLWIDPLMRQGLGIMGGTRATQVSGTLANGQLVPYPVPVPGLP